MPGLVFELSVCQVAVPSMRNPGCQSTGGADSVARSTENRSEASNNQVMDILAEIIVGSPQCPAHRRGPRRAYPHQ